MDYKQLRQSQFDTPIGKMIALVDDDALHLLEFADRRGLELEIEKMRQSVKCLIVPGRTKITDMIDRELKAYFEGTLKSFQTPLKLYGSDFQKSVLKTLMDIPYGQTRSYKQQADILKNPNAVRAVARANGMNQIAIVIPCHRVIGSDGSLTGYAGGLSRKEWLLNHEGAIKISA
jgi:AraC family transcriptional regulator, regulatory protein of adaptative response / methylated-DNA-[protein]-cysteine methyltransferase